MIIKSLRAGLTVCLCAVATLAAAQTWPERPIRIVVPAPAGGSLDVTARTLAEVEFLMGRYITILLERQLKSVEFLKLIRRVEAPVAA